MSVQTTHKDYDENRDKWQLVSDAVDGSKAIKKAGIKYLPKPNATDSSNDNSIRYGQYKTRAQFVGYTSRTRKGWIGAIFRKAPALVLPSRIDYLSDTATRNGITLTNLSKKSTGEILDTGRDGLLTDYPQSEEGLTLSETQKNKAYLIEYEAQNIINWHESESKILDLVVLLESEEIATNEFSFKTEKRYRVLQLIDGVYNQSFYDDSANRLWIATPKKQDGSTFDYIPFSFIGAEDNDEQIDNAPLYDIAELNIGHYRNSADYEASCFWAGQPTPIVSGLTQSWVEQNGSEYKIGSSAAWLLPVDGDAKFLEASPNQMPQQAMKDKEVQMVAIGAQMIMPGGQAETLGAVKIKHASDSSSLATIAENVSAAYTARLIDAALFMGANPDDVEFELNTEFFDDDMDAPMITAQMMLVDRGYIAKDDLRDNLRRSNKVAADRTNEMLEDDSDDSLGLV